MGSNCAPPVADLFCGFFNARDLSYSIDVMRQSARKPADHDYPHFPHLHNEFKPQMEFYHL